MRALAQRIERMAKKDSTQDARKKRPAENQKPVVLSPLPPPPCPPDWELGPPTFIGMGTVAIGYHLVVPSALHPSRRRSLCSQGAALLLSVRVEQGNSTKTPLGGITSTSPDVPAWSPVSGRLAI